MKGKLGRILFRRIGGRIVPIRIANIADKVADASSASSKYRNIVAKLPTGEQIAKMTLEIPKKGKSAEVLAVNVEKKFQKLGISKNMFQRAMEFLGKAGKKFLRSSDIQHPAQVKIRKRAASIYRAGGKRKAGSRFFADQFGPYQEETRRVLSKEAIEILKRNPNGRSVKGTTMIPKKYRIKK